MTVRHVRLSVAVFGLVAAGFASSAIADGMAPAQRAKKRPPPAASEAYYRGPREPFPGWSRVDPYAYQYEPRGYYPYYNSGYWKPNCGQCVTYYQHPPYWAAWGYTPSVWEPVYDRDIRRHHW
jgi:hypothetical protein